MFSFRAVIHENNIEHYTKKLLLPSYMSYLSQEPFHFSEQKYNATGREDLLVLYSGEGRLEEVRLDPKEHALKLLTDLDWGLDPEQIQLSDDAIWLWTAGDESRITSKAPSESISSHERKASEMFLFFYPKQEFLGTESSTQFNSHDAYVSISRDEMFISLDVLRDYILARLRAILIPSSQQYQELGSSTSPMELYQVCGGFHFLTDSLGGELILDSADLIQDILRFARLERALGYLDQYIELDWSRTQAVFNDNGLLFRPIPNKKESPLS